MCLIVFLLHIAALEARASLLAQEGKKSACNAGDPGSIPGSGKSPGEGNGNPLQYFCLENSRDRGAWQATVHEVAKGQTRPHNWHTLGARLQFMGSQSRTRLSDWTELNWGARHNRIVCKILKYQWNGNPALVPQFLLEFSLPWLLKSLSLAVPATQPGRGKPLISLCPSQQTQIDPGSTRELTPLGVVLAPCRQMPRVHLAST